MVYIDGLGKQPNTATGGTVSSSSQLRAHIYSRYCSLPAGSSVQTHDSAASSNAVSKKSEVSGGAGGVGGGGSIEHDNSSTAAAADKDPTGTFGDSSWSSSETAQGVRTNNSFPDSLPLHRGETPAAPSTLSPSPSPSGPASNPGDSVSSLLVFYATDHHIRSREFLEFIYRKIFLLLLSWIAVVLFWTVQFPVLCKYPLETDQQQQTVYWSYESCQMALLVILICWVAWIIKVSERLKIKLLDFKVIILLRFSGKYYLLRLIAAHQFSSHCLFNANCYG